MTWLSIPLFALAQGLTNAEIGYLFAAPVVFQAPLNLMGGAYVDRIGGRRIMILSCCGLVIAGAWFISAQGFWMLMVGQLAMGLARAGFWPANWAMASELPGVRAVQLGRLNAAANLGQIAGTALSGVLLASAGFAWTFATLAGIGLVAFAAALCTPAAPRKAHTPGLRSNPLSGYRPMLRQPIILYALMCAYISALPYTLGASFFPVLLAQLEYSEETSGIVTALRALGSIGASLLVGRYVRTGPRAFWPVACALVVAIGVGLIPSVNHVLPIGLWMLVIGAGSAAMTLYFQITISEASRPEQRGSALALGGLGWGLSHMSTPLVMGWVADHFGLVAAFYVMGGISLLVALAIARMRRWAFAGVSTGKTA